MERQKFMRSKTPTAQDMKTQSSLEVPKQVRSVSFDEHQMEKERSRGSGGGGGGSGGSDGDGGALLAVPAPDARSSSFVSAGSGGACAELEVPRSWIRRLLCMKSKSLVCFHCHHMETWLAQQRDCVTPDRDAESSSAKDDINKSSDFVIPTITITPAQQTCEHPAMESAQLLELPQEPQAPQRRRSISRQKAFFVEPTERGLEEQIPVRGAYLAVPKLKYDRSAFVDSGFVKSGEVSPELEPRYQTLTRSSEQPPPADHHDDSRRKVTHSRRSGDGGARVLRSTPDWGEGAVSGEHLWAPTSASGDNCYVGVIDCQKHGSRMKCSACKIVVHLACMDILLDRVQFACKPTFRDVGVRQYREHASTLHHWVHRKSEKGKCKACGKALHAMLSFSSKEIVALSCSWCKDGYHNKESCFDLQRIGEKCSLGVQANIMVPPSWIVQLPRRGSFKSSLRKSPKQKNVSKKKGKDSKNEHKAFAIKPIPTADVNPVIVFINPKSGGNQGVKLLQKFQWLLNPRQVFDLSQGGPGPGLELYRKVPNLRILACGGDGTVGWVLSVLDGMGIRPAVGVLPLGTGNDLARALGWGGGYEDEPISKILANIGNSDKILLDRWQVTVVPNTAVTDVDMSIAKLDLALNVVNNYFSFGVDAQIALDFHEAREAHPEKFNSRIRNKIFYGTAGGIDLMQRKWRALMDSVMVECDGKDITPILKEIRPHAIVFLNIPCYGGGTHPWSSSGAWTVPSTDDGLIEVIALTTFQLPMLQAGAHGTRICQCSTAKIVTTIMIPMQVDGEACRLGPSIISISKLNQVTMLAKRKRGRVIAPQAAMEKLSFTVNLISMADYEQHHNDKELLAQTAESLGLLEVDATFDLQKLREMVQGLLAASPTHAHIKHWWFLDSETAERFFRIDKAQEHLHYPSDIGHEAIYILDETTLLIPYSESLLPETMASLDAGEPAVSLEPTASLDAGEPSVSLEPTTSLDAAGDAGDPSVSLELTASLACSGPSISLETPTVPAVSLEILQSMDMPRFAHSIDVSESHASARRAGHFTLRDRSESGIGSPAREPCPGSPEALSPSLPDTPDAAPAPVSATLTQPAMSPPLCTSPTPTVHQPTGESIAKFKTNLLEKSSDSLLKAAKNGNLKLIKQLHYAGYSLLSIDASGQTALHVAARCGHKNVVTYLLASAPSAIVHMRDGELGQTALHKAAASKRHAICCMLVAGGAHPAAADDHGDTPRHLALRAHDLDLAAYLHTQENFQSAAEKGETAV